MEVLINGSSYEGLGLPVEFSTCCVRALAFIRPHPMGWHDTIQADHVASENDATAEPAPKCGLDDVGIPVACGHMYLDTIRYEYDMNYGTH